MLFARCFRPCDVCSLLTYLDVCSFLIYWDVCNDLVRGDACIILLPTMRSEISGSLSSLDFVTDGRNSIVATSS